MLLYWDGYDAFAYYVQPSNALGEQDYHKVITLEVPLWPWFNQKLIFQFNCLLCLLVFQINQKKVIQVRLKYNFYRRYRFAHNL